MDRVLASAPDLVALEATMIGGGRPGQRVIVTPEAAPGLRRADFPARNTQKRLAAPAIRGDPLWKTPPVLNSS